MRSVFLPGLVLALAALPAEVHGQKSRFKDEEFLRIKPVVGDPLPEVSVYTPDGKEFRTTDLRGHYTVLVFGCLT